MHARAHRWRIVSGSVLAALLWAGGMAQEVGPPSRPTRVARVGVLTDNYPYSFRDTDGHIKGFAYDVVEGVEQAMGLRFVRTEGNTQEIAAAFKAGRLDMLQSLAQFPERENDADFSVPYLTMAGAIFVRQNETRIQTLDDLRGRKVAVHRGSLGETVLRRSGLEASIVYVQSVEQALEQLERGEADATMVTRLTGLTLASHLGLNHLKVLPAEVPGYDVRYCIAVQEGDRELLAQVNEGLAVLVRTGKFDEIYRRWFGHIEPGKYSVTQVVEAVAVGLALALLVAIWSSMRQRKLRQRIAGQAQALRASEERYRGLFEGAYDGLLVLDAGAERELVIEQTNPAARRLLQTGSGPAPGAKLRGVLGADAALYERLTGAIRTHQAIEFEHEKPGAAGWWRVSVSPLGSKVLVWLTDITEQTEVRQRLQKQDEHLRNSQKLEAVGTLAGGIAHDFNNLLTTILGNTQLMLLDMAPGRPEADMLKQIEKASRRARQLVQQILTFSRQTQASRQAVRLGPLIDEVIDFLRAVARGTVEFEHRGLSTAPEVPADPAQVHQVLMNIGTNAVQAMRGASGRLSFAEELVTVDAALRAQHPELKPGRYVRVAVRDTGPGMTPDIVARIFEPFFTTKPAGEGTGLGLSVVHGIMQQHAGAVTVYSEPGRGTCFNLYFPLATSQTNSGFEESAPAVPTGAGQRLLFVDDDPVIVNTVRKILLRLGYEVSAHQRPDDALLEFETTPGRFALVLSDLTMPGSNGLQLATRVRARRPDLPVILFSGFWSESDLAAARLLRVTATLYKPVSYEILGRTLAEHLPRNTVPATSG